jgi:cysteine desulfurase
MEPARELERRGQPVAFCGVDTQGLVDPADVIGRMDKDTGLVSVMLANNETGAVQPVERIGPVARKRGALVHTDAAQAVGKIKVDVNELGVDLLTIAGHKMYAPKGVGALYVRRGTTIRPLVLGGGQEGGIRPGTENIAYMAGLGEACAMAAEDLLDEETRQRGLGELLLQGLGELGIGCRVSALSAPRLPGTLSVGFRGLKSGDILSGLLTMDVGASGGAACHAGETTISGVLKAMDVPREYAEGTIRFSWGRTTTSDDIRELIVRLQMVFDGLKHEATPPR